MDLTKDQFELLSIVADGPDEGRFITGPTVRELTKLGAVTVREDRVRVTESGLQALAMHRARERVDAAQAELRRAASAHHHAVLQLTGEPLAEAEEDLCRAARAFVRAEQNALAIARRETLSLPVAERIERAMVVLEPAERALAEQFRKGL